MTDFRKHLEEMYKEIYGADQVNDHWLAVLDDEEITSLIIDVAKLGVRVSGLSAGYQIDRLQTSLKAYRRNKSVSHQHPERG
jgi:hypothetical protein